MKIFLFLFYLVFFSGCSTIEYSKLDPEHLVPPNLLLETYQYYVLNLPKIKNHRYMGIINFKEHNSHERFFIVNMYSGLVEKFLVAHGENSDPTNSGNASVFSNVIDTNMSSLGFYLTAETYQGNNGYSLRLDGLSETNSNARERGIVMHGAGYVYPGPKMGTSWGCPAVEMRHHQHIIDELKEGALLFASFE